MMLAVLVGKNIQKFRKAKNLSEMDIFKRTGLDQSNLNKIELAKKGATLQKLHKIARALECSLYDLFTEEDGSHATIDRFIEKCLDSSPKLRAAYPDPLKLAWLFDTRFLDAYTIKRIEAIANGEEEWDEFGSA